MCVVYALFFEIHHITPYDVLPRSLIDSTRTINVIGVSEEHETTDDLDVSGDLFLHTCMNDWSVLGKKCVEVRVANEHFR